MRAVKRHGSARADRAPLRALAAVIGALAVLWWLAAPAAAHAALVESSPADGEDTGAGPDEVVLLFNEPMQRPATIEVLGPEGDAVVDGEPEIDGERVTVGLGSLDAEGTYTVRWRVVSADDHPLEGSFTFEVTAADGAADEGAEAPEESADVGESEGDAEAPEGPADDGAAPADEGSPDDDEPAGQEGPAPGQDSSGLVAAAGGSSEPTAGVLPWLLAAAALAAVTATGAAAWAQRRRPVESRDPV